MYSSRLYESERQLSDWWVGGCCAYSISTQTLVQFLDSALMNTTVVDQLTGLCLTILQHSTTPTLSPHQQQPESICHALSLWAWPHQYPDATLLAYPLVLFQGSPGNTSGSTWHSKSELQYLPA
jgi:hypothetical protein